MPMTAPKSPAHGDREAEGTQKENPANEAVKRGGELEAFLSSSKNQAELAASDLEFVRVIDDLLDVLIAKGVINFTDLPQEAQEKFLRRDQLRRSDRGLDLLGDDDLI